MNSEEEKYMLRCIQLAQNGLCNTAPNPMVGAVIVCDGKIIGEGYHVRCGEAHAEVNAIRSVKDTSLLKRSTIYVSLEPCSHYGKTPPCADLIIEKQIPRIVIGCRDPFSKVAGRGIQKLKDAGREVIVGVLETECRQLIRRFITFHTLRRPYCEDLIQSVRTRFYDKVCQTQLFRQIDAVIVHLHTDKLVCSHGFCQHQGCQADGAKAGDKNGVVSADTDLLDSLINGSETAGYLCAVFVGKLVRKGAWSIPPVCRCGLFCGCS